MHKQALLLLFTLLFISGCKPKHIDENKFIKIYTDIIIMKDSTGNTTENVKGEVFKKYNITSKDYESTLKYYNEDPERWDTFFEKAIAYLESQRNKK